MYGLPDGAAPSDDTAPSWPGWGAVKLGGPDARGWTVDVDGNAVNGAWSVDHGIVETLTNALLLRPPQARRRMDFAALINKSLGRAAGGEVLVLALAAVALYLVTKKGR